MALHCADVSNPSKQWSTYEQWVDKCMEEFFRQGDKERELGMKISPFMDRRNPTIAKCQVGFLSFIVKPLFQAWTQMLPGLQNTIMSNIENNLEKWTNLQVEFERSTATASPVSLQSLSEVSEEEGTEA